MLYEVNAKLSQALKKAKPKIEEMNKRLEKYKAKMKEPKECRFCNNIMEMSMSNITMTYDKVNLSFDHKSVSHQNSFMNQDFEEFMDEMSAPKVVDPTEKGQGSGRTTGGVPCKAKMPSDKNKFIKGAPIASKRPSSNE